MAFIDFPGSQSYIFENIMTNKLKMREGLYGAFILPSPYNVGYSLNAKNTII